MAVGVICRLDWAGSSRWLFPSCLVSQVDGWNSLELAKCLFYLFTWLLFLPRVVRLLTWWLAFSTACVSKDPDGRYKSSYDLALEETYYNPHCLIHLGQDPNGSRGAMHECGYQEMWFSRGPSLENRWNISLDPCAGIENIKEGRYHFRMGREIPWSQR